MTVALLSGNRREFSSLALHCHSRFSALFKAFLITVLPEKSQVKTSWSQLRLSFDVQIVCVHISTLLMSKDSEICDLLLLAEEKMKVG